MPDFISQKVWKVTDTWPSMLALAPTQLGLDLYDPAAAMVITPSNRYYVGDMNRHVPLLAF